MRRACKMLRIYKRFIRQTQSRAGRQENNYRHEQTRTLELPHMGMGEFSVVVARTQNRGKMVCEKCYISGNQKLARENFVGANKNKLHLMLLNK